MAETPPGRDSLTPANPLYLREDELLAGVELLNRAYRSFARRGERAIHEAGLGAAHLRALQVIARTPAITVGDLILTLGITKQSLSPVMQDLLAAGFVAQDADPADRRRRRLTLTDRGAEVERRATANQRRRLAEAYRQAGPEAGAGFRQVLSGLADR